MTTLAELLGKPLKILRAPGQIFNPDAFDLSLVGHPSNKEEIIMAKSKKDGEPVTYDFTEISGETKSALGLAYVALKPHIDAGTLPEEVGHFYKSAAEALDLEAETVVIEKAGHNGEDEDKDEDDKDKKKKKKFNFDKNEDEDKDKVISKSAASIIREALPVIISKAQEEAVKPLQIEIRKAQETIDALQGRLDREDMIDVARTLTIDGGDPADELVDQLTVIRKSMDDPKKWESYLEGQRGLKAQIEQGKLFEKSMLPSAQTTSEGSAFAQLQTIADGIIQKSENKDKSAAFDIAIEQNPKLYDRYVSEQTQQAKAADAVA